MVDTTERLVARAARASSSGASASNWVTSAEEARVAKLPNTTGIVASTVGFKSVWRWA